MKWSLLNACLAYSIALVIALASWRLHLTLASASEVSPEATTSSIETKSDGLSNVGLWQLAWLEIEGTEEKEDASSEA